MTTYKVIRNFNTQLGSFKSYVEAYNYMHKYRCECKTRIKIRRVDS